MTHHPRHSRHYRSLGAKLGLAAAAILLVGSCTQKEADFFFGVGQFGPGQVAASVLGTPDGATVRIQGPGIDESRTVGPSGTVFLLDLDGSFSLAVTPPAGYACSPTTATVVLDAVNRSRSVTFECAPLLGSFGLSLSGLTGLTLDLSLTGPSARTGALGSGGLTFNDLMAGSYMWSFPALSGYDCMPLSGSFTLVPGGSESASVACTPTTGTLQVVVNGATADVTYSGPANGSLTGVGSSGSSVTGTPTGDYTVTVVPPSGFTCSPESQVATVPTDGTGTATFSCTPAIGTLQVFVNGATADVTYSGPANGSLTGVGSSGSSVTGTPTGDYTVTVVPPSGFTCSPESQTAAVPTGGTGTATFTCTPMPGIISVQVNSQPATVSWTGPVSGSGTFGATAIDIPDLPPGSYTFTITEPVGATCTPATVDVTLVPGGTGSAVFNCTATVFALAFELAGFPNAGGFVSSGTYTRLLVDEFHVVRGSAPVSTVGFSTFYGSSPDRLGFSPGSGYRFGVPATIDGHPFSLSGFAWCGLNVILDGAHPITATFYDPGNVVLGTQVMTSAPSCLWSGTPPGTSSITLTGPGDRSADVNNVLLWGSIN